VHGLVICWLSAHFNRKASRYAKHDGSMMSKIMIARSFHLYPGHKYGDSNYQDIDLFGLFTSITKRNLTFHDILLSS
jgi:hypothetical protein